MRHFWKITTIFMVAVVAKLVLDVLQGDVSCPPLPPGL